MPESKCSANILTCAAVSFKFVGKQPKKGKTMRSILEEFAYGNISPEVQTFQRNSPYGQAIEAVAGCEEKLLNTLSGEEKDLFEKYVDAQGEVNQLTAVKNLIYGYKLGLLMTAEAFITGNDLIAGG